jgi:glycosyltransferase involved in cell wall biosynthesis
MDRRGMNIGSDLLYGLRLGRVLRDWDPDIVIAYTHKPIVFGALGALVWRVRGEFFGLVTGLGALFEESAGVKRALARIGLCMLYRLAKHKFSGIVFQNRDDEQLFIDKCMVGERIPRLVVGGSGVDLDWFAFRLPVAARASVACSVVESGERALPRCMRFLLIARLLRGKGVLEYVEAARIVRAQFGRVEFGVVGWEDEADVDVGTERMRSLDCEGVIVFHGRQEDVRPFLEECDVFVLPSYYREGVPRSVLEAMAVGRAVITTDCVGCRETVRLTESGVVARAQGADVLKGENGFLVKAKSVDALVRSMCEFIHDPSMAVSMGIRSRQLCEELFDARKVAADIVRFTGACGMAEFDRGYDG